MLSQAATVPIRSAQPSGPAVRGKRVMAVRLVVGGIIGLLVAGVLVAILVGVFSYLRDYR